MAEFKYGQRVQVTLPQSEGKYLCPSSEDDHHMVALEGGTARVPRSAIEAIEEPYEEGAIYEAGKGRARWMYSPDGSSRPWVFLSAPPGTYSERRFGDRWSDLYRATKLVPSE